MKKYRRNLYTITFSIPNLSNLTASSKSANTQVSLSFKRAWGDNKFSLNNGNGLETQPEASWFLTIAAAETERENSYIN